MSSRRITFLLLFLRHPDITSDACVTLLGATVMMGCPSAMSRTLLAIVALWLTPVVRLSAADDPRPVVGAIRWDGWYGEGSVVSQVEYSLGQPKYHFRLPWFARVVSAGQVSINGDSQAIIEQEIEYAALAGLNYWAFVDYVNESRDMHLALNRYLAVEDKQGVRYCFVEEGSRLDRVGTPVWSRLVEHFQHPDYQTVLDGRPLLFVFVKTTKLGKMEWDELKQQTIAAGVKPPYLVLMGWNPEQDSKDMVELGFDAVSAYARGGSYSMEQPSYAQQCEMIRRDRWEKCRSLKVPHITFASSGWDTRPRNERPPTWMQAVTATPDPTPIAEQKPLIDSVTSTPHELAAHIREAVEWTNANRDINPANAVIIYAWNEHDEGGWLQPTLGESGEPNAERIKAIEKVLRPMPLKPDAAKP